MRLRSLGMLAAAAVMLAGSAVANAATVTYGTTGIFGGSGTNVISNGGMTITYNKIAAGSSVDAPTIASLGTFVVSGSPTGNFSSNFTLTVTQTVPTGGSQNFGVGTLSGTLSVNNSNALITFANPTTISIGPISYTLLTSDFGGGTKGIALVPPSVNSGSSTLQAQITAVPVPAAAWAGLSTLGGLGVVGALRKRRSA